MSRGRQRLVLAGALAGAVSAGLFAGRTLEHKAIRTARTGPDPAAADLLTPAPADRTRRVVASDGVPLHVQEYGSPAAPLTVVFAHGWTMSSRCWPYQVRDLAGPGVRLICYDQRGHGASGLPSAASCTIEQFGRDLAAVIEECAPDGPLVLVGHSMGGMTIMGYAAAHPDAFGAAGRVRGVALLSTSAGRLAELSLGVPTVFARAVRYGQPALWRAVARYADRLDSRRAFSGSDLSYTLTRRIAFGGPVPPSMITLMETMIDQVSLEVVASCAEEFLRHDKLAALAVLRSTPTVIVVGEADLLTPPSHAEAMAAELPDAELVVLAGAGHMSMLERPGLVDVHLSDLLARAAAPSR